MRSRSTRAAIARTAAVSVLAAGVLACAAACTGGSGGSGGTQSQPGTATGATSSSTGAHSSGGGSYSDSGAVLTALKTVGHACTPVAGSATPALSAPGLRSATACSIGSGGGTVTATVFDDHTDAQAYASLLTSSQASGLLIGGAAQRAVLGQNWVVLVPDDAAYAQQVSSALGGSLVGPSSGAAG